MRHLHKLLWLDPVALMGLCICLATAGCASSLSPSLSQLFSEVRQSEIRAIAKYRSEVIEVSGVVGEVGVRSVQRLVAHRTDSRTAREGRETVAYPYVYLHEHGQAHGDRVLGYFTPGEIDEVAAIQVGQPVRARCRFQEVTHAADRVEVILKQCGLVD